VCHNSDIIKGEQKSGHSEVLAALKEKILNFLQNGEGDFGGLLLEAHVLQRENCEPYGRFCAQQAALESWQEIPALPLSAFRHAPIRCFPAEQIVRSFHTSGTTGEGHGTHDFFTLDLYREAALGGWQRAGLPRLETLCLVSSPELAPHSSLSCMAGWLAPEENFLLGRWDELVTRIEAAEVPLTLFGTALAFLDFFEWLGDRALHLPSGSLALETGGYKGTRRNLPKADLYALFESRLGLPADSVWNEYGMTELSSQFYTHGLGLPHRSAPWVRGLVLNPETGHEVEEGEIGVLRIFDLANLGSCCALQTRDLAIRRGEDFELLGRDPAALPRGCSRAADAMLSGLGGESH
jgi:hypothetical protein